MYSGRSSMGVLCPLSVAACHLPRDRCQSFTRALHVRVQKRQTTRTRLVTLHSPATMVRSPPRPPPPPPPPWAPNPLGSKSSSPPLISTISTLFALAPTAYA